MSSSTVSSLIGEKYYRNYSNLVNYHRDYSDYLINRRCCKKSINGINILKVDDFLGNGRCCGNNILRSYNNYRDFLRDKNCCANLVVLNAYLKYIKNN